MTQNRKAAVVTIYTSFLTEIPRRERLATRNTLIGSSLLFLQVPQGFGASSEDGGETVVEIKPVADLETLLSDINTTLEHNYYPVPPLVGMDTAPWCEANSFEVEQPFGLQEDLTLYDDMPTEQKPNIVELQKQMNLPLLHHAPVPSREATTLTAMPVSVSHDIEMDEARKEVDNVCLQLGIPAGRFYHMAWQVAGGGKLHTHKALAVAVALRGFEHDPTVNAICGQMIHTHRNVHARASRYLWAGEQRWEWPECVALADSPHFGNFVYHKSEPAHRFHELHKKCPKSVYVLVDHTFPGYEHLNKGLNLKAKSDILVLRFA